jgi:uncharacterized protein with HEPN domain
LEIVSEASRHLAEAMEIRHPEIPIRDMRADLRDAIRTSGELLASATVTAPPDRASFSRTPSNQEAP